MQPKNPIPLDYRRALRWLSWKAGNNYSVLSERPDSFVEAYRTWNRLIDVADVLATAQRAEQGAIDCLEGNLHVEGQPCVVPTFGDFRDGVCEVATRLAARRFAVCGYLDVDAPVFWCLGGSELEMIFAIYTNNVAVDGNLAATNHRYAMSRLELYFSKYGESNTLAQWECDHDPGV